MNTANDNEIRLKLLKLIENSPDITQRGMNRSMGVSLGKVNYCITELVKKGLIKVERVQHASKKAAYLYHLTPEGIEEIAVLTVSFLKQKARQYDEIKEEIRYFLQEMNKIDSELLKDPEVTQTLKKIEK